MHTWAASLAGCRAGSSFPRSGSVFTVHSVFERALNLRTEEGQLVALVADPWLAHPRAVVVRSVGFEDSTLESGQVLNLPITELGLTFAEPSTERVRRPHSDPLPTLAEAAHAVEAVVTRREDPGLYAAALADGLQRLRVSLTEGTPDQQWQAIEALVGLGPGLTPAGDDLLCGFLAGLEAQGALGDLPARAHQVDWEARTGAISAAFLTEAFRGRYGAALVAFGEAALGHRGDLQATVDVLARLGHSSGTDAALGFLGAWREGAT